MRLHDHHIYAQTCNLFNKFLNFTLYTHIIFYGYVTLASSKTSRIFFSDSPDIPETMEGAEILRKGTPSSYCNRRKMFNTFKDRYF